MNNFVLALLLTIIAFIVLNPSILQLVQTKIFRAGKTLVTYPTTITHTLVFLILAYLLLVIVNKPCKENFFFEVSKNIPKCCKGYIGRPTSFEFTSSNDINNGFGSYGQGVSCAQVREQSTNPRFGWDGMVNQNPSNIVGSGNQPQSGMTYYSCNSTQRP